MRNGSTLFFAIIYYGILLWNFSFSSTAISIVDVQITFNGANVSINVIPEKSFLSIKDCKALHSINFERRHEVANILQFCDQFHNFYEALTAAHPALTRRCLAASDLQSHQKYFILGLVIVLSVLILFGIMIIVTQHFRHTAAISKIQRQSVRVSANAPFQ